MNFLSHFYFDKDETDPHRVMGMVLPDLLKNANKEWNIRPEKHEDQYHDPAIRSLFAGWKRHIDVDKYFHSSDFFFHHTSLIRKAISPLLSSSPTRPFFVAHIALELMLDSLLLTEKSLDTAIFYSHLGMAEKHTLELFFEINDVQPPEIFFRFLDEFINAAYLNSYSNPSQIVYALNRICMRVWDNPFDENQKTELRAVLIEYQENLKADFMNVFEEIGARLI